MVTRILTGHNIDVLATLPAASCHIAICSPPYWSLRAYGTEPQVWANPDGTAPCIGGTDLRTGEAIDGHEWGEVGKSQATNRNGHGGSTLDKQRAPVRDGTLMLNPSTGTTCARCGAWRGELGSEPTVELYIAHLVEVFRAVRRVLRKDGTCWVNLAGSYFNDPGGQNGGTNMGFSTKSTLHGTGEHTKGRQMARISAKAVEANKQAGRQDRTGAVPKNYWLKPLDFVDVPGLFARAMQQDDWLWRADIALVKRSPMPESVSGTRFERCRVKVAPVANNAAIDATAAALGMDRHTARLNVPTAERHLDAEWQDCPGCPKCRDNDGLVLRRGNGRPTRSWEHLLVFAAGPGYFWDSEGTREPLISKPQRYLTNGDPTGAADDPLNARSGGGLRDKRRYDGVPQGNPAGRNLRDWQFFPTNQLKEQHYASYSPDLAALAIKAGTSEAGCCAVCGAPWARVVERHDQGWDGSVYGERVVAAANGAKSGGTVRSTLGSSHGRLTGKTNTLAWRPTCSPKCLGHSQAPRPAVVLDPFVGAGSTLLAAESLGRDSIGIDLNGDYAAIAIKRATTGYTEVTTDNNGSTTLRQRDLFSLLDELEGAEA